MSEYTVEIVKDAFNKAAHMSSRPDATKFSFYKDDAVIDEEQSVRWNREEIERRNQAYVDEVSRLRQERRIAEREADSTAKSYIMQETGMNHKQATIYFDYIYNEYHPYSIDEMINKLDQFISLYIEMKEAE